MNAVGGFGGAPYVLELHRIIIIIIRCFYIQLSFFFSFFCSVRHRGFNFQRVASAGFHPDVMNPKNIT